GAVAGAGLIRRALVGDPGALGVAQQQLDVLGRALQRRAHHLLEARHDLRPGGTPAHKPQKLGLACTRHRFGSHLSIVRLMQSAVILGGARTRCKRPLLAPTWGHLAPCERWSGSTSPRICVMSHPTAPSKPTVPRWPARSPMYSRVIRR